LLKELEEGKVRKTLNMMRLMLASLLLALVGSASAQDDQAGAPTIRAGRNIAMTKCIACHVVSPNQAFPPVLGPGIPSFLEIASRPDVTTMSLSQSMKTARWHDYALPSTLLPMSRLSDKERNQVVAFILSLRGEHD
jgi:mono/diheme cytochrome c family protein